MDKVIQELINKGENEKAAKLLLSHMCKTDILKLFLVCLYYEKVTLHDSYEFQLDLAAELLEDYVTKPYSQETYNKARAFDSLTESIKRIKSKLYEEPTITSLKFSGIEEVKFNRLLEIANLLIDIREVMIGHVAISSWASRISKYPQALLYGVNLIKLRDLEAASSLLAPEL